MKNSLEKAKRGAGRRGFLKNGLAAAGTACLSSRLLASRLPLFGQEESLDGDSGPITKYCRWELR
jgi:hypothetical protein